MQRWMLVLTFAFCLLLKVAQAEENENMAASVDAVIAAEPAVIVPANSAPASNVVNDRTPIQNNITFNSPAPMSTANSAPLGDASSVLSAKTSEPTIARASLIPMIGGANYSGRWADHISNSYSLGLALEVNATSNLAFELEGGFNRFNTRYLSLGSQPRIYSHDFNQYSIGANSKLYLVRSFINPYVGGGVAALYYENMDRGVMAPFSTYNQWVGAASLMAGADVNVSQQIAVGLRGAWLLPVLNRPTVADNGVNAYPGYEDASLMSTSQIRVLGTVRMAF
jgi:opacity protein-like surface antigen